MWLHDYENYLLTILISYSLLHYNTHVYLGHTHVQLYNRVFYVSVSLVEYTHKQINDLIIVYNSSPVKLDSTCLGIVYGIVLLKRSDHNNSLFPLPISLSVVQQILNRPRPSWFEAVVLPLIEYVVTKSVKLVTMKIAPNSKYAHHCLFIKIILLLTRLMKLIIQTKNSFSLCCRLLK